MDTELNKEELNQEDLEKAAGGTFDRNYYSQSEYEAVGITVVTHWIERDEFWWKGEKTFPMMLICIREKKSC